MRASACLVLSSLGGRAYLPNCLEMGRCALLPNEASRVNKKQIKLMAASQDNGQWVNICAGIKDTGKWGNCGRLQMKLQFSSLRRIATFSVAGERVSSPRT